MTMTFWSSVNPDADPRDDIDADQESRFEDDAHDDEFRIGDDPERLARPHWTVKLKAENAALKAKNKKFRQQVWEILREVQYGGLVAKAALQEIELRLREVQLTADDD
jgi:O6-methylguanine-DNA--protein-cysteine methyltransferase